MLMFGVLHTNTGGARVSSEREHGVQQAVNTNNKTKGIQSPSFIPITFCNSKT